MFDLEKSIGDWRKQMLAVGIKSPVPLEELELHLREAIEMQVQSGTNPQQAFENSVQRIGHADGLKGEFKKICGTKCDAKWSLLWMGSIGLIATIITNLAGMFIFHKSSSIFFSHQWWSDWFPNYIVWTIFTIVGLIAAFSNGKLRFRLKLKFKTTKN